MVILIPSYEPNNRLLTLLSQLSSHLPHQPVVIVDDGSGPAYDAWFQQAAELGADVVRYPTNRGKGHALKVGFAHIERCYPGQQVVCADSDGQHSPTDIRRVAEHLEQSDADVVLGSRLFVGQVPARSKFGNTLTSKAFGLVTGRTLLDTQTGLRAYPARLLPWLQQVEGDRFEYELRLLLQGARHGQHIEELPIETIYLEQNASSHFRPLQDSARVYRPLLAFALSSFAGFLIDAAVLFALVTLTGQLAASAVVARIVSASVNFAVNRGWVFRTRGSAETGAPLRTAVLRYAALATFLLGANILLLEALWHLTNNLVLAKVATEAVLFTLSFLVQKVYVFSRSGGARGAAATVEPLETGAREQNRRSTSGFQPHLR